jgi:hypothetical protein
MVYFFKDKIGNFESNFLKDKIGNFWFCWKVYICTCECISTKMFTKKRSHELSKRGKNSPQSPPKTILQVKPFFKALFARPRFSVEIHIAEHKNVVGDNV